MRSPQTCRTFAGTIDATPEASQRARVSFANGGPAPGIPASQIVCPHCHREPSGFAALPSRGPDLAEHRPSLILALVLLSVWFITRPPAPAPAPLLSFPVPTWQVPASGASSPSGADRGSALPQIVPLSHALP